MLLRRFCALALTLVFAPPAAAQLVTSLDAGAVSVTYDNGYRVAAMSLSPAVRHEAARASLLATATLSRFETGSFSTNGALSGSVFSSGTAPIRGELAGWLGGSAHEDGSRTGQYQGYLRAHLLGSAAGVWLGGGAGQTWDGLMWRMTRSAEIGGWWRLNGLLLSGSVEPSATGDTSFTDLEMSARWNRARLEIGVGAGVRRSHVTDKASWTHASGTWWIGRNFALYAGGGSYPTDYVQRIPAGKYVSFGLRIASRPPVIELPRVNTPRLAPELARPVAGRLELRRTETGGSSLRLHAPGARRVELMGDFTDWKIVSLEPARDGAWQLPRSIPAGTYRFNVRVDGGAWGVPRGVTPITDDFEGVVGILSVR